MTRYTELICVYLSKCGDVAVGSEPVNYLEVKVTIF